MKRWFSARELAAMRLPGIPTSVRGVLAMAKRENWGAAVVSGKRVARRRRGRGGGVEYHVNALPLATQRALADQERADAPWFWRWRFHLFSLVVTIEIQKLGGRL